jgi:ElaB/YqjD/DUF883 family membrane-anchored ribosome-binding protein
MTGATNERTQSQSATEQVKERVQDVTGQAKGQSREQLRRQLSQRSTQAGTQFGSAADAMRRTSEQLREEGKDSVAKAMDAVADRGEQLGNYLTRADGDQILRDVEDLARRQPWLFVGGSAVIGFLASRFMKASSSARYRSSQSGYPSRDVAGASGAGYVSPPALPAAESSGRSGQEATGARSGGVAGGVD